MPGIPENPPGKALVPPLSAVSRTHALRTCPHVLSAHTLPSVLSHLLAAVCSTILSPHVLPSPCHQCRVLHGHTCSRVHIHGLGLSPPPRTGLTLTLPLCASAPRYARPPAHPHH